MVNPFDKNFFNFLLGFALILCGSFAILYITGVYKDIHSDTRASVVPITSGR
jgi:multisubunit Na+/H+ antiporter MnhG subunit